MRRHILTLFLFTTALLALACGGDEPVAIEPELSLDPAEATIAAKGGKLYIVVNCNMSWTAVSNQPWCAVATPGGQNNGEIQLTVAANDSKTAARQATVTVTSDTKQMTLNVSQSADIPSVEINGFQIFFSLDARNSDGYLPALDRIGACLEVVNKCPQAIVDNLKKHPIWVNQITSETGVGVYHPASESSEIAGCIEIRNMSNFLAQTNLRQPAVLMNYMARLYLDQYASESFKNTLATTYATALGKRDGNFENNNEKVLNKYDLVYVLTDGNKVKIARARVVAPAKANKETYFAELTEAYWGGNDHYPFDYFELQRYDEGGFALMQNIWGARNLTETGPVTLPPTTRKIWMFQNTIENKRGVPDNFDVDPYYRKYLKTGCGIVIMASRFVCDSALVQAGKVVDIMMEKITSLDPSVITEMDKAHFTIGITGKHELITDLPQCRYWDVWMPRNDPDYPSWNDRGRGYGATNQDPIMPIGEENIVNVGGDPYGESILVHEFAHCVDWGIGKSIILKAQVYPALTNALANAKKPENRLWMGTYAIEDDLSSWSEYFAEAVQAYFNCASIDVPYPAGDPRLGKFLMKTREQLIDYDPYFYNNVMLPFFTNKTLTGYHFTWR